MNMKNSIYSGIGLIYAAKSVRVNGRKCWRGWLKCSPVGIFRGDDYIEEIVYIKADWNSTYFSKR
jgi:hypothetical protein